MSYFEEISTLPILSQPQEVRFYIYTTTGVVSRPINLLLTGNSDLSADESNNISFQVTDRDPAHYITGDSLGLNSESVEFELEIEVVQEDINGIFSAGGMITIDSDSRFMYGAESKYKNILFGPSDIKIFGEFNLENSLYNFYVEDFRPYVNIIGSSYNKILWKANVAIPIGFKQNFWLNSSDQRVFRKILDTHFYLGDTNPQSIIDSLFIGIISSVNNLYDTYKQNDFVQLDQDIHWIDDSFPFTPVAISASDATYECGFNVKITTEDEEGSLYSPLVRFSSTGDSLENFIYQISSTVSYVDVGGLYSSNMVMIQVTANSDDYEIRSLSPFYSNSIKPTVTVYDDDNIRENSFGFLQAIAIFNAFKDTKSIYSKETRLIIPRIEEVSLSGFTADILELNIWNNILEEEDVGGLVSENIEFLLGIFSPDNRFGLNRFIYIDDTTLGDNNKNIPWFGEGGNLLKLKDTMFYDIDISKADNSIFTISGMKFYNIILDWEAWEINDSRLEIGTPSISSYLRIYEDTTGKEIVFSRGDVYSNIISARDIPLVNSQLELFYGTKESELVEAEELLATIPSFDSGSFERKSSILVSLRYRKYSDMLNRIVNGDVYDQWAIDQMTEYLMSEESIEILEYFSEFNFNPFVVSDIALNKNISAAGYNIFDKCRIVTDGVSSAVVAPDLTTASGTEVSNVISTKLKYLTNTYAPINITENKHTYSDSKAVKLIDPCGLSEVCSAITIIGSKYPITSHTSHPVFIKTVHIPIFPDLLDKNIPIVSSYSKRWNIGISLMVNHSELEQYVQLGSTTESLESILSISASVSIIEEEDPFQRDFANQIVSSLGVSISTEQDTDSFIQGRSFFELTTSSIAHGLSFEGSVTIEGVDIRGMISTPAPISILSNDKNTNSAISDFKAIVSVTNIELSRRNGLRSASGYMLINEKLRSTKGFTHKNFIWLKTFFPTTIDSAFIQAKIMDFNISELDQYKNFYIPFVYVDETSAAGASLPGKPGQPDISEKALKEFDVPDLKRGVISTGFICGMMSYLDYQGYDHIYTVGSSTIFGNTSVENRELLNSGYIRAVISPVITQGKKISEADMFQRSLVDLGVSYLKDVEVVTDWNMEDFKLDVDDFQNGIDPADLDRFGEITATGISNILDTIGKDIEVDEQMKKLSYFPEFEDRPAEYDNSLETTIEINQYLVSTEEEVIDV